MGAGPQALTDSPTARPGRSLCSRSGGREGGGAGFPAGGAEPALEKEEEEEKGGKGVVGVTVQSAKDRAEPAGPPGGEAGRGETAGPQLGVSTLANGHKLTFSAGSAVASVSWLLPSSFAPPNSVLPHHSLRRLALSVPLAALFPRSAWAGLGWGVMRRWAGIPGGGGASPTPGTARGALPQCWPMAVRGSAIWVGLGTFGE